MLKKATALLLILAALLSFAPVRAEVSAADIRGYAGKSGYQYVQFGSYFTEENGAKKPILWRVLRSANGEAYILSSYVQRPSQGREIDLD